MSTNLNAQRCLSIIDEIESSLNVRLAELFPIVGALQELSGQKANLELVIARHAGERSHWYEALRSIERATTLKEARSLATKALIARFGPLLEGPL